MIDRRQFLRGVIATGVVAVGAATVGTAVASAAPTGQTSSSLGSTESWLLSTGRRALA